MVETLGSLQASLYIAEVVKNIMDVTTQVEGASASKEDIKIKLQESTNTQQQIKNVLEVNKIQEKTGTQIKEIKAGDLQISRNDLSLKEIILKGNEHYYKNEYNEAIECYDKAIKIEPSNFDLWFNKGYALIQLEKYEETIECYDKAIKIEPNDALAWDTKGIALVNLGKNNEAIECYDKAIEIDPSYTLAQDNKTNLLREYSDYKGNKVSNKKIKWYTADGKPVYY